MSKVKQILAFGHCQEFGSVRIAIDPAREEVAYKITGSERRVAHLTNVDEIQGAISAQSFLSKSNEHADDIVRALKFAALQINAHLKGKR